MTPIACRTTHVVDQISLTLPIILLSVTLLCQVAAIAFLIWRRKNAGVNRHYAIAPLPVLALTARFVPANGLPVAAVLAVLVIAAQVVLTYLLLTSDLIRRKPEKTFGEEDEDETEEEELAAEEETDPEDLVDADATAGMIRDGNVYHFTFTNENGEAQAYDPAVVFDDEDEVYAESVEEYTDVLEAEEDAPKFAFDDADEIDDIDDSYLTVNEDDDLPDDIDDSKETE